MFISILTSFYYCVDLRYLKGKRKGKVTFGDGGGRLGIAQEAGTARNTRDACFGLLVFRSYFV